MCWHQRDQLSPTQPSSVWSDTGTQLCETAEWEAKMPLLSFCCRHIAYKPQLPWTPLNGNFKGNSISKLPPKEASRTTRRAHGLYAKSTQQPQASSQGSAPSPAMPPRGRHCDSPPALTAGAAEILRLNLLISVCCRRTRFAQASTATRYYLLCSGS